MTLANWPAGFPAPQVSGYSLAPADLRQKAETDAGSVYTRNFNGGGCEVSCTLVLDNTQAAVFETFEATTLAQGACWFQLPLWSCGQILTQAARFKERPTASIVGPGHTAYAFTLELRERAGLLTAEQAALYLSTDPHGLLIL